MSRQLPENPNLEHLKNQAKELLHNLKRQESDSQLSDALHAVARDYGFPSWPKLKAHVEALVSRGNPFIGEWIAESGAKLHFTVNPDSVTITDVAVGTRNSVPTGGEETQSVHGYSVAGRWLGPRVLEAVTKKAGADVGRVVYEVSADRDRLTLSAQSVAHDGYPATDQSVAFSRV
jgi:hypothetical protein